MHQQASVDPAVCGNVVYMKWRSRLGRDVDMLVGRLRPQGNGGGPGAGDPEA